MLRLAADADVHGGIVRGLRRMTELDLERAQDALPEGTPDPDVLSWAAAENRVLINNDRSTMVGFANRRANAAEPMPGLIVTNDRQSVGSAIDDIALIAIGMSEQEMRDLAVVFLPYRG